MNVIPHELNENMIAAVEVLASRGLWMHIYRMVMSLNTTANFVRTIMHVAYNAADRALEWSCSLDKSKEFTDGCLLCEGFITLRCTGCENDCWECKEYISHDCSNWHYKYNEKRRCRPIEQVNLYAYCIVCNSFADAITDTCDTCNGILCKECFQDKCCTCSSFYDGSMHDVDECVMAVLELVD